MPELTPEKRAAGSRLWTSREHLLAAHPDGLCDCDWTTPKTLAQLRHRILPTPDQTRYGPRPRDRQETPHAE